MNPFLPPAVSTADVPPVPGLRYLPEYLSEADERALVVAVDGSPWNTEWRRRQPYGAGYGTTGKPLPISDWGRRLADRLFADAVTDVPFDQMLVNEYLPGQGIAPHRDYEPYGRTVASLSLLSSCVMDLRHPPTGRKEHLLLAPRSLLVLSDEARYAWEHGIAPRKKDRWTGTRIDRRRRLSVTFRFLTGARGHSETRWQAGDTAEA